MNDDSVTALPICLQGLPVYLASFLLSNGTTTSLTYLVEEIKDFPNFGHLFNVVLLTWTIDVFSYHMYIIIDHYHLAILLI